MIEACFVAVAAAWSLTCSITTVFAGISADGVIDSEESGVLNGYRKAPTPMMSSALAPIVTTKLLFITTPFGFECIVFLVL
jgi:hypothetical protein